MDGSERRDRIDLAGTCGHWLQRDAPIFFANFLSNFCLLQDECQDANAAENAIVQRS
jgi:hypothetical protein